MLRGNTISRVRFCGGRLFLKRRGVGRHIFRSRLIRNVGMASLGLLILLGALVAFPAIHREDKVEAAFTPSTTTLNIVSGRSSANVNVKPVSNNGTFAASDGNDTASFDVITNNYSGYVLKLKANEATGGLINDDSSESIGSISTPADAAAFISDLTGAYTNKWGIKPSMVNSAPNAYYLPAPINTGNSGTTTEIMMDSTSTANPTVAKNYTVGIGTKVDYTKPIGTYTNTYTVVAVGNPATYKISYSAGGVTGISGTMPSPTVGSATSVSDTTATVTLASSSLTRTGYDFAGWCYGTISGTTANPGTTCTGTLITNRTLVIDLNQTINNEATVYATWTAKSYTCTKQYFLETATGTFSTTPSGSETASVAYNNTCEYKKTITDYKGSTDSTGGINTSITNGAQGSNTCTITTSGCTVKLYFYRNTYALAVSKDSNVTTVSGGGNKMWGQSVTASATAFATGYKFLAWRANNASGTTLSSNASYTFEMPKTTTTVYATATAKTYTVTLSNTGATTNGSTSVTATYNGGVGSITAPKKQYTASGFTISSNNATGATVANSGTKTYSYTFNGWYTASSGGSRVITSGGVLAASVSGYTNSSSKWVKDGAATLYSQWVDGTNVTLPTIQKTGYTCGWTTTSSGATTIGYTSGGSYKLSSNITLYGVCKINSYTLNLALNSGNGQNIRFREPTTESTYSKAYNYGTQITVKVDYSWGTFNGFYEGSTLLSSGSSSTVNSHQVRTYTFNMPARNLTITAKGTCTVMSGTPSMQDFGSYGSAYCPGTVKDTRDNHTYTVAYLNRWIMTQNLSIGCNGNQRKVLSLTSSNSNVSTTFSTDVAWMGSTNSYDDPAITCAASDKGAWYNFAAASAGTIKNKSNTTTNSSYDVCPKGWRLPTGDELATVANYFYNGSEFQPIIGGLYIEKTLQNTTTGAYWSSTIGDSSNADQRRRNFLYNNNGDGGATMQNQNRRNGLYVRCVRK